MRSLHILGTATLLLAGCSVINAFDDVVEGTDASATGGIAGTGGGSGGDAGGTGGDSGSGGSPGGSGGASGGSGGASGSDGGTAQPGAIVMGGRVANSGPPPQEVLVALSPYDGSELVREVTPRPITGLAYDGATGRDIWYVFRFSEAPPSQATQLSVRRLKREPTGTTWEELDTLDVPPVFDEKAIVVLNRRLVYLALDGTDTQLYAIDTSDPENVSALPPLDVSSEFKGVLGHPSGSQAGGVLTLIRIQGAGQESLGLQKAQVQATGGAQLVDPTPTVVGSFFPPQSFPAWAQNNADSRDVVVIPPAPSDAGLPPAQLRQFSSSAHSPATNTTFAVGGGNFRQLAFDPCRKLAIAILLNQGNGIVVSPVQGGTPHFESLNLAGQRVFYEPYTKTVLAPFQQGSNSAMRPFDLQGTAQEPVLTSKTLNFPSDLVPSGPMAVEQPLTAQYVPTCN